MKKKLLAAAAAVIMLTSQAVCASADWGWGYDDYNYGYDDYGYGDQTWTDNTWTDNTWTDQTWTDSASDSSETESKADEANNIPVNVILSQSQIVDKRFNLDLKLETRNVVTGIDMTILYDSAVLKLTGNVVNKKAASKQGKGVAAETEPGVIQYQFNDPAGSEWKDSFLTLSFEIIDPLQRSSAIYMKVNSILDENSVPLTYRADGAIVQIEGAVEFDAKDDESMYTELRVAKSDKPVSLESLGLQNVASVTFEDKRIAGTDNQSITTLAEGLTNMTVEFSDGTKKYYRLVVSKSAPAAVTTASGNTGTPDKQAAGEAQDQQGAEAQKQAVQDNGVIKTETKDNSKVKSTIIYLLIIVAAIAIIVEYFVFFGNPYKKAAAAMKQKKAAEPVEGEGFNGSPLSIPDRDRDNAGDDGDYDDYDGDFEYDDGGNGDGGSEDGWEYEDGESGGYEDGEEYQEDAGDGYEYDDGGDGDDAEYEEYYSDDDDAYESYEDGGVYVIDTSMTEDYDGFGGAADADGDGEEFIIDDYTEEDEYDGDSGEYDYEFDEEAEFIEDDDDEYEYAGDGEDDDDDGAYREGTIDINECDFEGEDVFFDEDGDGDDGDEE